LTPAYLLDTNICAYIQRRNPERVRERFNSLKAGEAAISVITHGELLYGAEKSDRRAQILRMLEEFADFVQVLPLPAAAAATYGAIRAGLERRGEIIGNNDLWIAAHARAADLTLVTNNTREFRRIAGLRIENWAS
jgi:tRNA(fMet)-specific endonuclease VapC